MQVTNMNSPRSGKPVANQYVIKDKNKTYFQSYESLIAVKDKNGNITLDNYFWDYSRTTLRYLAQFLRYNTGEAINGKTDIQSHIDRGEYKLANLN